MIEELFNLIKNNASEAIINNPEVPNEMNEQAMAIAHNSLIDGLRGFNADEMSSLQSYVQADNFEAPNQQMSMLSDGMGKGLMEKLGLNGGATKAIIALLLPILLKKIFSGGSNNAANNGVQSEGGFDMGSILGSILGGGQGAAPNAGGDNGILGNLGGIGKMLGLDKNSDGKIDLNDLGGLLGK